MEYISDVIGDQYKEWNGGQPVYLSSPTGSGKTTFVFDKLLPFYAKNNIKILIIAKFNFKKNSNKIYKTKRLMNKIMSDIINNKRNEPRNRTLEKHYQSGITFS